MTDISSPTEPDFGPPPQPGWQPSWPPPATPWPEGSPPPPPPPSAGGGGWGAWSPPGPGWYPPPSPPPAGTGRRTVAAVVAAAVLAGAIGVGLGGLVFRRGSTVGAGATASPSAPSAPSLPSFPGVSGSGSTNTDPATAAIAAKVDPGVVDVTSTLAQGTAEGTGMIISSNGEVLTNNHVIDGATAVTVQVAGQGRTYTAKVVGEDPTDDVAVLQIQGGSNFKTVNTGNSSALAVGDAIVAIGNALGRGGTPAAVSGAVQALGQTITASDPGARSAERLTGLIQVDAPLQPGDSGGPLVNRAGVVVGMDTAASSTRFDAASGAGFAIPINAALSIASQIEAGKADGNIQIGVPGFLGVEVSPDTTGSGGGAAIQGVVAGTPAAKAGLTGGDTITAVDGTQIDAPTTLTTLLHGHKPGDVVKVTWVDQQGQSHTASVTLASGPAD